MLVIFNLFDINDLVIFSFRRFWKNVYNVIVKYIR